MQDNPVSISHHLVPQDGSFTADSTCPMSDFKIENDPYDYVGNIFSNCKEDPSDLMITAEVLSSIRKRFLSGSVERDLIQDHEMGQVKVSKKCKTEDIHELQSPVLKHQHFLCKYKDMQSSQQELFQCYSASSDQDFINSNDSQRSPDTTFTHLPFPRTPTETLSDSYDLTQVSIYPDSCGSSLSEYAIQGAELQQKEKTHVKSNHILPPCRVCGDKASGFHYGANTCEACKGFFRRSLKKDIIEYKCSGNNNCLIQKGRRNNCPLCRYNKCLAIGMSKNAIKTGRYTHEKRTKDIVEVKQLSGDFIPLSTKPRHESRSSSPRSTTSLGPEHEKLLDKIYTAHKMLFPYWHKIQETGVLQANMRDYVNKYLKKKIMLAEVQEPVKDEIDWPVKQSVHIGDRSSTIQFITKHLELVITVFVKFAKAIPGFCDLTLNDQAALVKLSRFEVWMVGAHKFFNCELEVVSGPRGNSYHMEELCDVIDCDFVKAMFAFSKSLQGIYLSHEETALIKCVVLTFSDRSALQEPEKVDQIQLRLIACLESLVNSGRRFSQIMSALVSLRDLTEWHISISENMVIEWPTIKRHPLLLEIMSV